jgi:hypothetical protein
LQRTGTGSTSSIHWLELIMLEYGPNGNGKPLVDEVAATSVGAGPSRTSRPICCGLENEPLPENARLPSLE